MSTYKDIFSHITNWWKGPSKFLIGGYWAFTLHRYEKPRFNRELPCLLILLDIYTTTKVIPNWWKGSSKFLIRGCPKI